MNGDAEAPRSSGPIVITGTSGLLGGYLFTRWGGAGFRTTRPATPAVHGFDRNGSDRPNTHTVDLTDAPAVTAAVGEIRPALIVNCAAMTNVDACEDDEATATAINATAVATLAAAAETVGARLIHISTDAVLGDYGSRPYTEQDESRPINAYGRTKFGGEVAARAAHDSLTLRTTIFGWNTTRKKGSFGEWLYGMIREHRNATVFSDVRFAPIYIGLFADLLEIAIREEITGLYHLAGADTVSKELFAREMARQMARPDDNLATGTLADVPLRAPRAHNMALDSTAFATRCRVSLPDYTESIAAFLADAPTGEMPTASAPAADASATDTHRR